MSSPEASDSDVVTGPVRGTDELARSNLILLAVNTTLLALNLALPAINDDRLQQNAEGVGGAYAGQQTDPRDGSSITDLSNTNRMNDNSEGGADLGDTEDSDIADSDKKNPRAIMDDRIENPKSLFDQSDPLDVLDEGRLKPQIDKILEPGTRDLFYKGTQKELEYKPGPIKL